MGKRNLEAAIASVREHFVVNVRWLPFLLRPATLLVCVQMLGYVAGEWDAELASAAPLEEERTQQQSVFVIGNGSSQPLPIEKLYLGLASKRYSCTRSQCNSR